MSEKLKSRLYNVLAIILGIGAIVVVCCLYGCGQGVLEIGPVRDTDGSYLRNPDGTVVLRYRGKVNTLFKDITFGEFGSESNKVTAFYPPFYIDTKGKDDE